MTDPADAIRDAALNALADGTRNAATDASTAIDVDAIYNTTAKTLDQFVENITIDVVIPERTWDARFWQKYIASYGVALGDLNIGSARAM